MKKKIFLGILFLLVLISLPMGLYLVSQKTSLFSKAAPSTAPTDIKISNLSDNSFTVSWLTAEKATVGFIKYGLDSASLEGSAADDRDQGGSPQARFTHHVTLKKLKPQTTYYYKITSGAEMFDNKGQPFLQQSAVTVDKTPAVPSPVFGSVKKPDQSLATDSLVYVTLPGASLLSSYSRSDGNWLITLNNSRSADLQNYLVPKNGDQMIINAAAGPFGQVQTQTGYNDHPQAIPLILEEPQTEQTPTSWISLFRAIWGSKGKGSSLDLNKDGTVNTLDFSQAIKNKGQGK